MLSSLFNITWQNSSYQKIIKDDAFTPHVSSFTTVQRVIFILSTVSNFIEMRVIYSEAVELLKSYLRGREFLSIVDFVYVYCPSGAKSNRS
jgi:hypothetical protein